MHHLVAVGAAVAALVALAGGAGAQPNDACTGRPNVNFLPYLQIVQNAAATLDPGEASPTCAAPGFGHSLWYALTPPRNAVYKLATCGSDFDTVMQVYDGVVYPGCEPFTPRATGCNDDSALCGPGSKQSAVLARLGPLDIVHAQVGSVGPAAGTVRFTMELVPPALNDTCAQSRFVSGAVFRDLLDVAAVGGGDPPDRTFLTRCGGPNVDLGPEPRTVWYRWQATRAGPVRIDAEGSTTPFTVAVFKEGPLGCARLGARAACARGGPVVFNAIPGQVYRVYVAADTGAETDVLVFRLTGPNLPPAVRVAPVPPAAPGAPVQLGASATTDPDGDRLTFAWTQVAGPAVALDDPAAADPAFTAPAGAGDVTLDFQVAVTDGDAVVTAPVRVEVTSSVADEDVDGVPIPTDQCPATPPGEAVDARGCSCSDAGHRDCSNVGGPCAPGRCDPTTGACVPEPVAAGLPCPDDGNLCTDDVCDGAGACGHVPRSCARTCREGECDPETGQCVGRMLPQGAACVDDRNPCTADVCDGAGECVHPIRGSYAGLVCRIDTVGSLLAGVPGTGRAQALLLRARLAAARAEAHVVVGDRRRTRRRLGQAERLLARLSRTVAALEADQRLGSELAGRVLGEVREAGETAHELRRTVRPARRR